MPSDIIRPSTYRPLYIRYAGLVNDPIPPHHDPRPPARLPSLPVKLQAAKHRVGLGEILTPKNGYVFKGREKKGDMDFFLGKKWHTQQQQKRLGFLGEAKPESKKEGDPYEDVFFRGSLNGTHLGEGSSLMLKCMVIMRDPSVSLIHE